MKRDHNPLRYFPWLARDVALFPGTIYLAVIVIIGVIFWRIGVTNGMAAQATRNGVDSIGMVQHSVWNACLTIAILMAIGGVVGLDVQRGFYRTFFCKPMAPWWYYLQRFLLGGVVVMCAPFLLGLALKLSLQAGTGLTGELIATIALGYLLLASACLLLSVFFPYGWVVVFIVELLQRFFGIVTTGLRGASVDPPTILVWVHRILPPFDLIQPMTPGLHGKDLAHVLIYGCAMLLGALLLLRYRPLGSGGRA